jgi:hypothetical protein
MKTLQIITSGTVKGGCPIPNPGRKAKTMKSLTRNEASTVKGGMLIKGGG